MIDSIGEPIMKSKQITGSPDIGLVNIRSQEKTKGKRIVNWLLRVTR